MRAANSTAAAIASASASEPHDTVALIIFATEANALCSGFSTTTPQSGRITGATVPSIVVGRPSRVSSYDSVRRCGAFMKSATILSPETSGRRTSTLGSLWISTLPLRSTRNAVTSPLPSSRMRSVIGRRLTIPSTVPRTWLLSMTGTATTTAGWLSAVSVWNVPVYGCPCAGGSGGGAGPREAGAVEVRRPRPRAVALAVEDAQAEDAAVGRDVVGHDVALRRERERIGARRQSALHRPHRCRDLGELLRAAGDRRLHVGGDADGGARQVLFLERLERVAVDADEEVVRDDERQEADQDHRAEERPEKAAAAGGRRRGGGGGHRARL